jgi:hypothetical protein
MPLEIICQSPGKEAKVPEDPQCVITVESPQSFPYEEIYFV